MKSKLVVEVEESVLVVEPVLVVELVLEVELDPVVLVLEVEEIGSILEVVLEVVLVLEFVGVVLAAVPTLPEGPDPFRYTLHFPLDTFTKVYPLAFNSSFKDFP
jgi:hypothetical protein